MTHNITLAVNHLRRQLLAYRSFWDGDIEAQSTIDTIVRLSNEELLILTFLYKKGRARTKEIEEAIHASRSTTLKYCKQLEDLSLVARIVDREENPNIKPAYSFYLMNGIAPKAFADIQAGMIEISTDEKAFSSSGSDQSSMPVAEDCTDSRLASIAERISELTPIGKKILEIISSSGITAKQAAHEIRCASTTANKHLKELFEAGLLIREKLTENIGEYLYFPSNDLLALLNPLNSDRKQENAEAEISMDNKMPLTQPLSQSTSGVLSKLKQWRMLNRQIQQIERELIALEGKDAEELLAELKKELF